MSNPDANIHVAAPDRGVHDVDALTALLRAQQPDGVPGWDAVRFVDARRAIVGSAVRIATNRLSALDELDEAVRHAATWRPLTVYQRTLVVAWEAGPPGWTFDWSRFTAWGGW